MMERLEESLNLFGNDIGHSTCGDFTCAICGIKYNEGNDAIENYSDDSVLFTDFAGVTICGDCFGDVEKEILDRMSDIIYWYKRLLDRQKSLNEQFQAALKKIMDRSN